MKEPWEWDETDLKKLIENQVPEGLHLDYKQSEALHKNKPTGNNHISKDVAALVNSDSGTIVYVIFEDAKAHLPVRIDDGYDPSEVNKDWIEQVINGTIHRRLDGVRITTVSLPHVPGRVAYVVKEPFQNKLVNHRQR